MIMVSMQSFIPPLIQQYVFGVSLCVKHSAMPLRFHSELSGSYHGLVGETNKERDKIQGRGAGWQAQCWG